MPSIILFALAQCTTWHKGTTLRNQSSFSGFMDFCFHFIQLAVLLPIKATVCHYSMAKQPDTQVYLWSDLAHTVLWSTVRCMVWHTLITYEKFSFTWYTAGRVLLQHIARVAGTPEGPGGVDTPVVAQCALVHLTLIYILHLWRALHRVFPLLLLLFPDGEGLFRERGVWHYRTRREDCH